MAVTMRVAIPAVANRSASAGFGPGERERDHQHSHNQRGGHRRGLEADEERDCYQR